MKKIICLVAFMCLICATVSADNIVFAFDALEYNVLKGKTIKLKPILQGSTAALTYAWETSDDAIATVNQGTVKGLSVGEVTITCTGSDKSGNVYTASCIVNVLQPVTKITVDEKNVELISGQHYIPNLTIEPDNASIKDIEWKSSNPKVAMPVQWDGGGFYVSSVGAATLTGTAADGSGKTVTINVTIKKVYTTHKEITLKEKEPVEFGYCFNNMSGFFSVSTTGDCFSLQSSNHEYTEEESANGLDEIEYYNIVPVKYGTGSIVFKINGSTVKTIPIKVQHSAVYDDVSYPTVLISQVLSNKEKNIGKNASVVVTVKDSKVYEYETEKPENAPHGIVYCLTGTTGKYWAAFEHVTEAHFNKEDKYKLYGTIERYETFTTETGLQYECPVFVDIKLVKQ